MSLLKVKNNTLEESVNSGVAIIDFYADWCGPCRRVAPIIEEIANEQQSITVCKVNVDENSALASRYGIVSIPTIVILKDGEEVERMVGYRPKEVILEALE